MRRRPLLGTVLAAGLLVRALLAFVVYPGLGFAGDVNLFLQWSQGISARGPGAFYGGDATANYAPVSIYAFWGLHGIAATVASIFGGTPDHALLVLLKLPAILADVGVAALAYVLGRDLYGPQTGLVAAVLAVVVPPLWYTSALWGQIDSVLAFFSMAALALLIKARSELAAVAAVCAVMVKPQGIAVVLVVGVVLLVRHGSNSDGARQIGRLVSSAVAGLVAALALIVPFDYQTLAPPRWAQIPVLGDLAGFAAQSVQTSELAPVLTANAYNIWALAGDPPLVRSIGSGTAVWSPDSVTVWGVAAGLLGIALLGLAVLAVVVGLMVRHDAVAILFGYVVLTSALYVLPTRSHERYLIPAFAAGAILAAPYAWRIVAYLAMGLLNLVNLHAVLAGPLGMMTQRVSGDRAFGGGPPSGGRPPGGFGPRPGRGAPPGADYDPSPRATDISLPFGALARTEWVAVTVSLAQTAAMAALLVGWLVFVVRALRRRAEARVR